MLFRKPLTLSVLTERRVLRPYGLHGGESGARGVNILQRASDGKELYLGGKCSVPVETGDVFTLRTPGGGGWGKDEGLNGDGEQERKRKKVEKKEFLAKGSVYEYQQTQLSA